MSLITIDAVFMTKKKEKVDLNSPWRRKLWGLAFGFDPGISARESSMLTTVLIPSNLGFIVRECHASVHTSIFFFYFNSWATLLLYFKICSVLLEMYWENIIYYCFITINRTRRVWNGDILLESKRNWLNPTGALIYSDLSFCNAASAKNLVNLEWVLQFSKVMGLL